MDQRHRSVTLAVRVAQAIDVGGSALVDLAPYELPAIAPVGGGERARAGSRGRCIAAVPIEEEAIERHFALAQEAAGVGDEERVAHRIDRGQAEAIQERRVV